MARSTPLLLLLVMILGVIDAGPVGGKMPMRPADMVRPRFPRRDTPYPVAYNIHKAFKPRDVNSLDVNSAQKAMVDVRQTIAEVQRLLSLDPSLPRLTKGEIEELFENVTREELNKSLREGDHARAQHMRALMLVLPYHTNNMNPENLQNIYNMPPVTKIVAGEEAAAKPVVTTTTGRPVFRQRSTTTEKVSTTAVPITTIRFTTPKPTTFHPALPNKIREEIKPATITQEPVQNVEPTEVIEVVTEPLEPEVVATEAVKQQEINEILSSIGFGDGVPPTFKPLPVEMTTPKEMGTTEQPGEMNEELKMLLRSFGLLKEDDETVGIAPLPQIDVPEELTEIQPAHLVQTDGLKVDELEPEVPMMAKPDIKPDDFVAFKPLPSDASKLNDDLDELLKSFGLLDNSGRNKKSMDQQIAAEGATEMGQMPMIDKDLVQIPQMASVLDTLGIQTMNTKKERSSRKYESKKESTGVEMKSNGVSAPKSKKKVENEDYRKLEQLWETIRELEKLNTTLTDDSLDALNLKNFNLSESLLAQGPNPLESLDLTRANEIKKKRQQPEKATTDTPTRISLDLGVTSDAKNVSFEIISTTNTEPRSPILDVESPADPPSSTASTTTTSSTTTTTTEESARFSALEDSFGGGADPVAQEPLPQPRRNGFYFLADWNSFLEVGEDPNKVVINFRPQAGDPSRFLPVNVP